MKQSFTRLQLPFVGLMTLILLVTAAGVGRSQVPVKEMAGEGTGPRVYLPIIRHKITASHTPIFGLQLYGDTSSSSSHYPFLADSGATWVRVPISWSVIESTNLPVSSYDWAAADKQLAAARVDMGRFNVIGTIDSNPDWAASSPGAPINPANLADFAEFVAAVVERYDGDGIADAPGSPVVNYWEFYNEPDANSVNQYPRWGENGAEYAQMLQTVYPVVKASNPNAKVLLGGLAYDWFEDQNGPFVREFLDDVLAAGGGAYFDIMNFHSYPAFASDWAPYGPGLLQKAANIRHKLQQYGYNDKPMVVTEAGWHTNNPPGPNVSGSHEIQGRYLVQLFTQSMAANLDVMIWWMLVDPGGGYWENGLVRVGENGTLTAKPSFAVYQWMVEELNSAQFVRSLTTAELGADDLEAYQFNDGLQNRTVYVTWLNPVTTDQFKPLRLPAAQATVRDMYNNWSLLSDGDDGTIDGMITVHVGGRPLYVEVNQ